MFVCICAFLSNWQLDCKSEEKEADTPEKVIVGSYLKAD